MASDKKFDMFNHNVERQINASEYYKNINIPDDWATLEDFVNWYIEEARMPLMVPFNAEVIMSDDAAAVCLFRKGAYQVEMYIQYPHMPILRHSHPNMEVITVSLGGGSLAPKDADPKLNVSRVWGTVQSNLKPGEFHGGVTAVGMGNGFVTLTFEKWLDPENMTSAAANWKGYMHGPVQAKLIKSKNKNALVQVGYPGFADVTKTETDPISENGTV